MKKTALVLRQGVVHLSGQGRAFADVPTRVLKTRVLRMLRAVGAASAEVSVALIDDVAMKALHAEWMGDRTTTDVLSFPLHEDPWRALREAPAVLLGDIAISVPVARKQARQHKHELMDEVTLLLAHGLLHLLGFDHRTRDEEHEMFAYGRLLEAAAVSKRPFGLTFSRDPS